MKTVPAKAGTVVSGPRKIGISVRRMLQEHTMDADQKKKRAAEAALAHVEENTIIGVGTGSTVNHFIDALAARKLRIKRAVSSAEASTARLKKHRIEIFDLNAAGDLDLYVDGADESDPYLRLIKGGGAA